MFYLHIIRMEPWKGGGFQVGLLSFYLTAATLFCFLAIGTENESQVSFSSGTRGSAL